MSTDLAQHIKQIKIIDTHEHLKKEQEWVKQGPGDVLADMFSHYVQGDLVVAGANPQAVEQLIDGTNPDVDRRWSAVANAWQAVQLTGYGEAVRIHAKQVYGIDEITPAALRAAQPILEQLRQPGQRLQLLRDRAHLDHVQVDDFSWQCLPDTSGPDFFLYDLMWQNFSNGYIKAENLVAETGVTVKDLTTLRQAMEALFEKYAPCAIAVKSQHAYSRTLHWVQRADADAERALQTALKVGSSEQFDEQTKLCLGDWCLARGCELAAKYNLPFKIHTGYYAGHGRMDVDRIRPGHLCPLLIQYPDTRFVLMHIAYPYHDELIALTKHFANVYADLCWAWSINPYVSADFVRRFLHGAPVNKLFAFGGDTFWPTNAYAFSVQARRWLTRALGEEIMAGDLTEKQAIDVATLILRGNQLACFDLDTTRTAILNVQAPTAV